MAQNLPFLAGSRRQMKVENDFKWILSRCRQIAHLLNLFAFVVFISFFTSLRAAGAEEGENEKLWSGLFAYGSMTDLADSRSPRAFTHSFDGMGEYHFNESWSLAGNLSLGVTSVNGQIPKDPNQSKGETLSPEAGLGLRHRFLFANKNRLISSGSWTSFMDEASRREGYLGLLSLGSQLVLPFKDLNYTMSHGFSLSHLMNTYEYGSNQLANPYLYLSYHLSNAWNFWAQWYLGYDFGIKMTRFLDDYFSYSYSNRYTLSYDGNPLSVELSYENGGFTDHGDVDLWYIDGYRRIVKANVAYAF